MNSNFSYRPDIDGIRALAVILVILFHAGISFTPGGYIGVDVFFVLSGFLISLSIDKEMSNNSFSFKQFYLRRIRRIIPVLIFVMLIVTIPAYIFLFADNLESYGRTLIHTFLSTNNFHLWLNSGNYFAENSDSIPLLHTWSLSVEEQYYMLWPLLLLFLHKKFSLEKRLVIIFIFLISGIFLSIYLTNINPKAAYFLLPARIFELTIGACLAMFWNKTPVLSKTQNSLISIVGLALIIAPAVLLSKSSIFPGLNAFWPCLGTALIIFTGKEIRNQGIVNKLLQNKILVFIGLLSYSMYLWHWPLFVFIKYLGINLEGSVRIISLLSIIGLSYFSWRFIEQPFRIKYKYNFKKTVLILVVPSFIAILLIYVFLDAKDGYPERFPNLSEFTQKTNFPNIVRKKCFNKYKIGNCEECFLGIKKDSLDGMLIGDSFANHTGAFLDVLAKDAGMYIHDSAASGYPLLNNLNNDGTPEFPSEYADNRLKFATKYKNIFIAANWNELSNPNSNNYKSILNTVGYLIKSGKKIIIFDSPRSTSEMDLHKLKLLKSGLPIFFSQKIFTIPFTPRPYNYIVYEMKRKFPSILIIDINDVLCKSGNCDVEIDNMILYRDPTHLNTSGGKLIGEKYLKLKGNPLKNL
ncbi:acyltransferase family protein [Flavobacterium sp. K5-23]|uniref:acyltransferase family protein n=1 Tax=Flavobacterium sp. K5-23 TaxID=2746225 RepID=UPI00200BB9F5|nr:acyltransferase family protein [Flavobacterium sp. K5-23]UQD57395.1 acyltransferase [Flavobacterium sp. K5-23]